jgi:hypothetical protein
MLFEAIRLSGQTPPAPKAKRAGRRRAGAAK